ECVSGGARAGARRPRQVARCGARGTVAREAVAPADAGCQREIGPTTAVDRVQPDRVAPRPPGWPGLGTAREVDEACGGEDGDAVALASRDPIRGDEVPVAARDRDADADEARQSSLDGTAARPLCVIVLRMIVACSCGGSASFA